MPVTYDIRVKARDYPVTYLTGLPRILVERGSDSGKRVSIGLGNLMLTVTKPEKAKTPSKSFTR